MNNELLPCPFCGDDEIMDFQAHLENRVQCAMCNVSTDTFPSCEESHAAWNTRTKAAPTEVPYALRQWAMDDEPESTLFDEGYNAARRWVKMQLEKPAEPTQPQSDAVIVPRAIAERMAIDAAQYEHEHAVVNDNVQLWQQPSARLTLTVGDLRTVRALLGGEA